MRRALAAALLLLAVSLSATGAELRPLTIITPDGRNLFFDVEVADTPEERARGLMHRRELDPRHGMLLWYPRPARASIWMKNTHLPLDIIFIDASGTVSRVHAGAVPLSETAIPAGGLVQGVLEINAPLAAELGIVPGSRVRTGADASPARSDR